jgi:hypothetical protein
LQNSLEFARFFGWRQWYSNYYLISGGYKYYCCQCSTRAPVGHPISHSISLAVQATYLSCSRREEQSADRRSPLFEDTTTYSSSLWWICCWWSPKVLSPRSLVLGRRLVLVDRSSVLPLFVLTEDSRPKKEYHWRYEFDIYFVSPIHAYIRCFVGSSCFCNGMHSCKRWRIWLHLVLESVFVVAFVGSNYTLFRYGIGSFWYCLSLGVEGNRHFVWV